jgi:hypothetical protein
MGETELTFGMIYISAIGLFWFLFDFSNLPDRVNFVYDLDIFNWFIRMFYMASKALIRSLRFSIEFTFLELLYSQFSFMVSNLTDLTNFLHDKHLLNWFIAIFYAIYRSLIGLF